LPWTFDSLLLYWICFEFDHKNKGGKKKKRACSFVYIDGTNTEQQVTVKADQDITFTYTDE